MSIPIFFYEVTHRRFLRTKKKPALSGLVWLLVGLGTDSAATPDNAADDRQIMN